LVEGVWSAARSKDSYLANKYRSLVRRKGPKKAILAVAHKILIAAYHIIKAKKRFQELASTYLDKYRKDKFITFYKGQLAKLGTSTDGLSLV
jgi:transposase